MRPHAMPSSRTTPNFHLHLGDILGGTTFETLVERGRPARASPIAVRRCDGCGHSALTVDLWAEDSETGEQLWLCTACGEW
jgi:hypothetical protein